jgi:heparosan-N-sulfate-glucuronate 5-epimerase
VSRRSLILAACVPMILLLAIPAWANYFPKDSFEQYSATGTYPFWSKNWTRLDPRIHFDDEGIPVVRYKSGGDQYNPVTVAIFALQAYNSFFENNAASDRAYFLKATRWLVEHQDARCGCWYNDFDFDYASLGETIRKPWISGMAQGLAISAMIRAYSLTHEAGYMRTAERAMLPFGKNVGDGGVARSFTLAPVDCEDESRLIFFEEYPTEPAPSFTLNGFMFALVGLYDMAQTGDARAAALLHKGMRTLEAALPLFDLPSGSAYDLGHLTRPPRAVHHDAGYHLIHITLLNALGTAADNRTLLRYRDRWNAYGSSMQKEAILFARVGHFAAKRYWPEGFAAAVLLISMAFLALRKRRKPEEAYA